MQKERQGREPDEKEKQVHVPLNIDTFLWGKEKALQEMGHKQRLTKSSQNTSSFSSEVCKNGKLGEKSKGQENGPVLPEKILNAASQLRSVSSQHFNTVSPFSSSLSLT